MTLFGKPSHGTRFLEANISMVRGNSVFYQAVIFPSDSEISYNAMNHDFIRPMTLFGRERYSIIFTYS